jgi:hypothetical protein
MNKKDSIKKEKTSNITNQKNILIYILICVLWCVIGIFIGRTIDEPHDIVGIYHTYNWYDDTEATITLNKDYTCTIPRSETMYETVNCKWGVEDSKTIKIDIVEKTSNNIENNNQISERKMELVLVDKGLLHGNILFEKID